ncbi:MAG: DEAD/DEAH box helicase family protein [Thermoleophilia bacterium]
MVEKVTEILAPTALIAPVLLQESRTASAELERVTFGRVRATASQLQTMKALTGRARAVVHGAVGTGKTVMAADRARRLAADGASVLVVCHRPHLARHLRQLLSFEGVVPSIRVVHRKTMVAREARLLGRANFDELVATGRPLAEGLEASPDLLALLPDAIVVDEGQDFDDDELDLLLKLLRVPESGPFYVFADPFQRRHGPGTLTNRWGEPCYLVENCRNTQPILRFAERAGGASRGLTSVEGPEPEAIVVLTHDVPAAVASERDLLMQEGFQQNEIVCIALDPDTAKQLRAEIGASQSDAGVTGGGAATTVPAFQGLESEIVLLAVTGQGLRAYEQVYGTKGLRRDLFIAATRARTVLKVVTDRLGWTLLTTLREDVDDGIAHVPSGPKEVVRQ